MHTISRPIEISILDVDQLGFEGEASRVPKRVAAYRRRLPICRVFAQGSHAYVQNTTLGTQR